MQTDAEIRERLSLLLHSPLTDSEWRLCNSEGWVEEIRKSPRPNETAHDVVGQIRRFRKAFGSEEDSGAALRARLTDQDPVSPADPPRILVVGLLMAGDADEYAPVVAFRQTHFEGRVLGQDEELERWLWERAREETSALVPGQSPLYLAYLGLHDELAYVPYLPGGALDRLKELTRELDQRYGWHEDEATTFVCRGRVPVPEEFEAIVVQREPFGVASRLVMTVDPALSPGALASLYQEQRKQLLTGERHRDLNARHRTLAWHYALNRSVPWQEQMRRWNETQRVDWRYTEVRNFHRDSTWAAKRLLRQADDQTSEEKPHPRDPVDTEADS